MMYVCVKFVYKRLFILQIIGPNAVVERKFERSMKIRSISMINADIAEMILWCKFVSSFFTNC